MSGGRSARPGLPSEASVAHTQKRLLQRETQGPWARLTSPIPPPQPYAGYQEGARKWQAHSRTERKPGEWQARLLGQSDC